MIRCSPGGAAPDWQNSTQPENWLSPRRWSAATTLSALICGQLLLLRKDPLYAKLARHYAPMINAVKTFECTPEEVSLGSMSFGPREVNAFGACFYPMSLTIRAAQSFEPLLTNTKMEGDNYYRNVLTIFGLGFDYKNYALMRRAVCLSRKII